jgi:hypothetical protein
MIDLSTLNQGDRVRVIASRYELVEQAIPVRFAVTALLLFIRVNPVIIGISLLNCSNHSSRRRQFTQPRA